MVYQSKRILLYTFLRFLWTTEMKEPPNCRFLSILLGKTGRFLRAVFSISTDNNRKNSDSLLNIYKYTFTIEQGI